MQPGRTISACLLSESDASRTTREREREKETERAHNGERKSDRYVLVARAREREMRAHRASTIDGNGHFKILAFFSPVRLLYCMHMLQSLRVVSSGVDSVSLFRLRSQLGRGGHLQFVIKSTCFFLMVVVVIVLKPERASEREMSSAKAIFSY